MTARNPVAADLARAVAVPAVVGIHERRVVAGVTSPLNAVVRPSLHVPCPDAATFRAHQSHHRQARDGSWGCEICEVER